jgi:tRNA dimethylallyltransferase
VVVGPTGIGKTQVAARLAAALSGEVVVADSRQVYRWLDVATNKPSAEQRAVTRYHCIDLIDPVWGFNAHEWLREAEDAVAGLLGSGRLPVIEGGSMLWIDALTLGFDFGGVPPDVRLRAELDRLPTAELAAEVRAIDPSARIDWSNRVRLVRAVETLRASGPPLSARRRRGRPPHSYVRIGLTAPSEVLAGRLEERSRSQLGGGLIAETASALEWGVPSTAAVLSGIGYAEAVSYLTGKLPYAELPGRMARSNLRYARRQLAWFRRNPATRWFEIEPDPVPDILRHLEKLTRGAAALD